MFFFLAFGVLILWRVVNISLVQGDKWREKGGKYVKLIDIDAERGNIFSEDGSLLATSNQFFEIRMDPAAPRQKDFDRYIDSLSIYLSIYAEGDRRASDWKKYLSSKRRAWEARKENGSRNILLVSKASYNLFNKFKKFPLFRLGDYKGGFVYTKFSRRDNPFKAWAARTIGEDRKNAINTGIEGSFDDYLKGTTVQKLMKCVSPARDIWIPLHDPTEIETRHGDDLVTTIDLEIQEICHTELLSAMMEQEAEAGVAIVMEVSTGEIKAISNISKNKVGKYGEFKNNAVGRLIEPGSTFKIATALALLESGKVSDNTTVDIKGARTSFYGVEMKDSEPHNYGVVDLEHVITKSSNVGIAKLAHKFYGKGENREEFINKLQDFGLRDKTGVTIQGEEAPYIKHPVRDKKSWYGTTVPWMAIGYELSMTPLQILNFYNAIANDGKLMEPLLVKEIWRDGEMVKEIQPKVKSQQIASIKNIELVQKYLKETVLTGTARKLKTDKYDFAGKTGTARVNYTKKAEKKEYNSSFAGYFPAENPKYSCYVLVFKPQKAYYGGSVAGPIFRAIADRCFTKKEALSKPMKNVANQDRVNLPDRGRGYANDFEKVFEFADLNYVKNTKGKWVEFESDSDKLKIQKSKIKTNEVPDVIGMGARDAIYVLENLGMNVEVYGMGRVSKQTIDAGTKILGQKIELYLN